tara:strand:- start:1 stop:552 length:552 start_codon:yes stop_codon:yes gene_type:complete
MNKNINKAFGFTVWFTGLSASGKSTQSKLLYKSLVEMGHTNVVLLDGESIRDKLKMYKFDEKSREEIGFHKAKIALDLNKKGKIVLISGIAHKKKWREDIRGMIENYYEIFLDCNVENCASRDFKGNYSKAMSGHLDNFIGVSEQYEYSEGYDLLINTADDTIQFCANKILESILNYMDEGVL